LASAILLAANPIGERAGEFPGLLCKTGTLQKNRLRFRRFTIKHYAAIIDHAAIGLKDIVFIEVTLDKHDEKVLARFADALAKIPEVIEANLVTGEYDYLVKVAVADTAHYERFLREKLYRIQGIRHSRSTFSLRTLKLIASADPLLIREHGERSLTTSGRRCSSA
jgi:DNA-binding Lrp family transcriptional regulator